MDIEISTAAIRKGKLRIAPRLIGAFLRSEETPYK
jgi:hypothetical protein